jgi:hypothetical protein
MKVRAARWQGITSFERFYLQLSTTASKWAQKQQELSRVTVSLSLMVQLFHALLQASCPARSTDTVMVTGSTFKSHHWKYILAMKAKTERPKPTNATRPMVLIFAVSSKNCQTGPLNQQITGTDPANTYITGPVRWEGCFVKSVILLVARTRIHTHQRTSERTVCTWNQLDVKLDSEPTAYTRVSLTRRTWH